MARQESLAVRLHSERDGDGRPVVLLHGFGQTARCWGALSAALTPGYEVIRLDAPGHGDTGGEGADLATTADLIAETAGPAAYVGYSMGGRMALQLAVDRPDVVQRLVVIGGTPGIEDDSERAARREADQALAQRIRDEGVDAFIRYWLDLPLFAGLPAEARFEDERRRNTAEGLATSLERAGTGSQEPLWDRLASIDVPVLLVAGQDDPRYVDLAFRTSAAIGVGTEVSLIPHAGHSAHLEQPERFTGALLRWLASWP
jgi:2-succinyl-6-hydroxy-2,4-cyclohexadiene-1-carboxylate synthase